MNDFERQIAEALAKAVLARNGEAMPSSVRVAKPLSYPDDAENEDLWHLIREEIEEIYDRLGSAPSEVDW